MKKLNIISIFILCTICFSCATYKALPETGNLASEEKVIQYCSVVRDEATKTIYCVTEDRLMYVSFKPYEGYPCEKLAFYASCGENNTGSVLWDFGDDTTSSLKNAEKTYEKAGDFDISVTCTYIDGSQVMGVLPITISNKYRYGYGVTEIKPGDTSCPRIDIGK